MASVIGRVGFVLKGAWDNSTSYDPLDVVIHNGNGYAAINPNQNVEPGSLGDTSWKLIVQKGDQGDPGNFTWAQVTAYCDQAVLDVFSPVEVKFTNVSSLPVTVSNANMTTSHKLIYYEISEPGDIVSLSATQGNGSVTLSGTLCLNKTLSYVITRWMLI